MLFFGQLSPIMPLVTVLNQKGDVSRWNSCSYMKENRFFPSLSPTVYLCYQVFPPTPHSFSSSSCISFASPFYCFCCTRSICCSIFQCLYFASNVSIWRFHNFERKAIPHFNQHFLKINNSITAHQKNFLHCSLFTCLVGVGILDFSSNIYTNRCFTKWIPCSKVGKGES